MKLKLCNLSLFLLTACQMPMTSGSTKPMPAPTLNDAKPVILAEPSPGLVLPEVKTDIGPKSTGPKPTAVDEIVDFFQTLKLDAPETKPNLMTQLQLSMSANKLLKPVYFTLMATLTNGDKAEVFRAQLNTEGQYVYSLSDLKQIQDWLGRLKNIQSLEFVFYSEVPSTNLTPIANVTPKIARHKDDDYSLDAEIDDEDERDFHEAEDEADDENHAEDDSESKTSDIQELEDDTEDSSGESNSDSNSSDSSDDSDSSDSLESSDDSDSSNDSDSSDSSNDSDSSDSSDDSDSSDSSDSNSDSSSHD